MYGSEAHPYISSHWNTSDDKIGQWFHDKQLLLILRMFFFLYVGFHDDFGDLYMDVFYFVNFIDVFFVFCLRFCLRRSAGILLTTTLDIPVILSQPRVQFRSSFCCNLQSLRPVAQQIGASPFK